MELNNENVNYLMERLQPKCSDILERCKWKGSLMRCDSLFQAINSSEGYCCSFNNYAFPKSNYDAKMVSSIPKQPRRVTACGYQTGLTLLLKPFVDDYFGTEIASNGFRVRIPLNFCITSKWRNYFIFDLPLQMMIHNSYDYADSNAVVKLVPSQSEAYMSIAPG